MGRDPYPDRLRLIPCMARVLLLNILEETSHPRQVSDVLAKTSISLKYLADACLEVKNMAEDAIYRFGKSKVVRAIFQT